MRRTGACTLRLGACGLQARARGTAATAVAAGVLPLQRRQLAARCGPAQRHYVMVHMLSRLEPHEIVVRF